MTPTTYQKHFGLLRNPAVRRELAQLDPARDHQRMVHLLTAYEFPFDITRALELALFATYASPRVSALLARTGEFHKHGQKRYDDTSLLIGRFMQDGYDSDMGQRAIAQMNRLHGQFRIPNDDFVFVLSTFVFYPIDWVNRYGWRQLTDNEQQALFLFFRQVGQRMNLRDLPDSPAALRDFTTEYERQHVRYADSNRRVADDTVQIVKNWFPPFLRFAIKPAISALLSEPLRRAFSYAPTPGWFASLIGAALWIRKQPLRFITFKRYPTRLETSTYRSYPAGIPEPEHTGPGF
jgi:hypothetical protein